MTGGTRTPGLDPSDPAQPPLSTSTHETPCPSSQRSKPRNVHLALLLHGLYGSPTNLWCLEEELRTAHENTREQKPRGETDANQSDNSPSTADLDLVVLNANSYVAARTWDGIDVNAQRVSEELDGEIERLEGEGRIVSAISITGYSLGGLIARALVGQLHARSPSFFDKHRPAAFATIATPHLGVLKYGSWQSQWVHALGQRLFSRTGQQLYCLDGTLSGSPLLATMAHPDRIYIRALSLFRSITIFANGVNDLTVPYCTAAICNHDPFIDHELLVDGRPHIHVELDGHMVCNWSNRDPDAEEVEDMCPLGAPTPDGTPQPERLPPSPPRAVTRETPATTTGLHGQRPWFPPVFYLNKPGVMRYALFPLVPFLIPLVLSIIAITFAYHSFQSSQRLQLLNTRGDRRPLLLGIDEHAPDSYGAMATATGTSTPAETAPNSDNDVPPTGTSTPQLAPAASAYSQPVLTPLQQSMITHLSTLPLERVVAWFPAAFNAHAVIIARNARKPRWAWQGAGRQVVQDWAGRIVATASAVVAETE